MTTHLDHCLIILAILVALRYRRGVGWLLLAALYLTLLVGGGLFALSLDLLEWLMGHVDKLGWAVSAYKAANNRRARLALVPWLALAFFLVPIIEAIGSGILFCARPFEAALRQLLQRLARHFFAPWQA